MTFVSALSHTMTSKNPSPVQDEEDSSMSQVPETMPYSQEVEGTPEKRTATMRESSSLPNSLAQGASAGGQAAGSSQHPKRPRPSLFESKPSTSSMIQVTAEAVFPESHMTGIHPGLPWANELKFSNARIITEF